MGAGEAAAAVSLRDFMVRPAAKLSATPSPIMEGKRNVYAPARNKIAVRYPAIESR